MPGFAYWSRMCEFGISCAGMIQSIFGRFVYWPGSLIMPNYTGTGTGTGTGTRARASDGWKADRSVRGEEGGEGCAGAGLRGIAWLRRAATEMCDSGESNAASADRGRSVALVLRCASHRMPGCCQACVACAVRTSPDLWESG